MKRLTLPHRILLLIFTILLSACSGEGFAPSKPETGDRGEFVSATVKSSYTATELQSLTTIYTAFNPFTPSMLYGADTYKITYWTIDPAGEPVKASGLLAIPANHDTSSTRLVGYHHGTVFHDAYVPSNLLEFDVISAIQASMDFIVV